LSFALAGSIAAAMICGGATFVATGCSSSSSTSPTNNAGDDGSAPGDDSTPDATTVEPDGSTPPKKDGGGDASSSHDGGTSDAAIATNTGSSGDAGAAAFCAAICAGLEQCSVGVDAGPCHCSPGSTALERADFVQSWTSCVTPAIEANCGDAGGAVEGCQVNAAAEVDPTAAAAAFCKDLEFTACANVVPNCLTNAGIYSDQTISAFANCFHDLPDANIDGGCVDFGNCLSLASNPSPTP
jgi:hypothetical protein